MKKRGTVTPWLAVAQGSPTTVLLTKGELFAEFKKLQDSLDEFWERDPGITCVVEDAVVRELGKIEQDPAFDSWFESYGFIDEGDIEAAVRKVVGKDYSAEPDAEKLLEYGQAFAATCIIRLRTEAYFTPDGEVYALSSEHLF